jgi:hypothetical protein
MGKYKRDAFSLWNKNTTKTHLFMHCKRTNMDTVSLQWIGRDTANNTVNGVRMCPCDTTRRNKSPYRLLPVRAF